MDCVAPPGAWAALSSVKSRPEPSDEYQMSHVGRLGSDGVPMGFRWGSDGVPMGFRWMATRWPLEPVGTPGSVAPQVVLPLAVGALESRPVGRSLGS